MLLRLSEWELPVNLEELFGRSGPVVLEIGFGDGRFIAAMARRFPTWNWLGAEVSGASVERARRRLLRAAVRHVRLYHGHGRVLLQNAVAPQTLHRVYVNFPDPWPKKRHHRKRLFGGPFFELISTRLAPGGLLLLTTDHADYYQFALQQARLSGLFHVETPPPPPEVLETKYALKWRREDKPIYHAVFRPLAACPAAFPVIERFPMPHAILAGALPPIDRFDKQVHAFDGGYVILLRAYRPLEGEGLLWLVQVEEGDLEQQLLITARPHERGVFVGLERFGDPLVTRGVKAAVGLVVDWLCSRGLELMDRAY